MSVIHAELRVREDELRLTRDGVPFATWANCLGILDKKVVAVGETPRQLVDEEPDPCLPSRIIWSRPFRTEAFDPDELVVVLRYATVVLTEPSRWTLWPRRVKWCIDWRGYESLEPTAQERLRALLREHRLDVAF